MRKSNIMHRHPKYPWLIANIDRKIEGERAVLEIKTVSPYSAWAIGARRHGRGGRVYIGQPHAYMLVLDYERAELAALFGLDELRRYHFERDKEMDELIIQTTHDFWHNHVLKGFRQRSMPIIQRHRRQLSAPIQAPTAPKSCCQIWSCIGTRC